MTTDTNAVTENTSGRSPAALVGFIVLCFSIAAVGGLFPPGQWYASLNRPVYAPPNWVFGPAWTVLYLLIAVSGWMVWKAAGLKAAKTAFAMYGLQLVLNAVWSGLFFGLQRPGIALAEIIVLWISIAATIVLFRQHSKVAGTLLLPYLAWVSFATVLNYGFWSLNG